MSVSTTHERVLYDLDGVTEEYSVTFQFFYEGHLVVSWGPEGDENTLSLGSDYTVATRPSDLPALGTITLDDPAALTGKLLIRRVTPRTQSLDLSASGPQDPEAYEDALDWDMLIEQEQDAAAGDAVATDFIHGNLGGGSLHAAATTSVNGFYPAADKVLNDGHRSATTSVHGIADTSKLVTTDTEQTITGRKTIAIGDNNPLIFDASNATGVGRMAVFLRRNESGGPLTGGWELGSYFDSQGAFRTDAAITISGNIGPLLADGWAVINTPVDEGEFPAMLYIWGDVGHGAIIRPFNNSSSAIDVVDEDENFVWSVAHDGIRFGPGPTPDEYDSRIYRNGFAALRTDSTWMVDGNIRAGPYGAGQSFLARAGVSGIDARGVDAEYRWGGSESNWNSLGMSRRANFADVLLGRNLSGVPSSDAYQTLATNSGGGYGAIELRWDGGINFYGASGATTAGASVSPTTIASLSNAGVLALKDGGQITTPSPGGTGIKIGAASEKLGFFAATPVVQQTLSGPLGSVPASSSIATALATFGLVTNSQVSPYNTPTYGVSVAIDASLGSEFAITVTNGTAFAIAAPSNPTIGQRITVRIRNNSGTTVGTITWNAVFKLATWTSPADGNSRAIDFFYNGTNWTEVSRTAADVPL